MDQESENIDAEVIPETKGHAITVYADRVTCICGFEFKTSRGDEALGVGYNHARVHGLAPLHDTRHDEPERKNVFDG